MQYTVKEPKQKRPVVKYSELEPGDFFVTKNYDCVDAGSYATAYMKVDYEHALNLDKYRLVPFSDNESVEKLKCKNTLELERYFE